MIQKILQFIESTTAYDEVIPIERLIRLVLLLVIINDKFKIEKDGETMSMHASASVFALYLSEQLDLYTEDEEFRIFIFASMMATYFLLIEDLMDDETVRTLLINKSTLTKGNRLENMSRTMLIELLRDLENKFSGKESNGRYI